MWWVVGGKLKRTKPSIKRVSLDIINRHNKYPITLSKKKSCTKQFSDDDKWKRFKNKKTDIGPPAGTCTLPPFNCMTTLS